MYFRLSKKLGYRLTQLDDYGILVLIIVYVKSWQENSFLTGVFLWKKFQSLFFFLPPIV